VEARTAEAIRSGFRQGLGFSSDKGRSAIDDQEDQAAGCGAQAFQSGGDAANTLKAKNGVSTQKKAPQA
jgi:hypothetical protein